MAMECMECLGRTPFASLMATVICIIGVGVFCGTSYKALSLIINDVLNDLFEFNVGWLEVIQVVFVVIAVAMAVFAVILLVFGFLATGATRQNVYSGAKCIMGGRVSAAFFTVITYILNLGWIVIMCFSIVPIILYTAIYSICNNEVYNRNADTLTYCFNLTQFGVYRGSTYSTSFSSPGKDSICEGEVKRMCDKKLD
ncbi:proteolipid protein DM beta-like [Gigantopelta aegis]|uniref:proteolipid protein DM beta-like n=1 Tax=Gigantopelta aegis TaxID=1735272 RepID=UPI001B88A1A5|nr:proteolipid protein DM beta-like [Gigantopelta aegis]